MEGHFTQSHKSSDTSNIGGHCIYCLRSSEDVPFSREHLIPASLHGKLVLSDFVCKDHNDVLGHQVDVELLRHPPVLKALRALGLEQDEQRIIKNHYNIVGKTNDPDVGDLRGFAGPNGFEMRPKYGLPDGSNIVPERDFLKILRKEVTRDPRLADIPPAFVDSRLEDARARYDRARPGERVPIPELGRTLLKRSHRLDIKLVPKKPASACRAIAKIAYEFGFFILGGPFLVSPPLDDLWNILWGIDGGPGRKRAYVGDSTHENPLFRPYHSIMMFWEDPVIRVDIELFGGILFTVQLVGADGSMFDVLAAQTGVRKTVGIAYQQHIARPGAGLWAISPDYRMTFLGWLPGHETDSW